MCFLSLKAGDALRSRDDQSPAIEFPVSEPLYDEIGDFREHRFDFRKRSNEAEHAVKPGLGVVMRDSVVGLLEPHDVQPAFVSQRIVIGRQNERLR